MMNEGHRVHIFKFTQSVLEIISYKENVPPPDLKKLWSLFYVCVKNIIATALNSLDINFYDYFGHIKEIFPYKMTSFHAYTHVSKVSVT